MYYARMNQLLLGASFPFAAALIYYACRGGRASFTMLTVTPAVILLSMLWAIIPDIPRLLGLRDLYYRLALDPRCNIFYWHYSIDLVEADSPLYSLGFAAIAACLLAAAWREIKFRENA